MQKFGIQIAAIAFLTICCTGAEPNYFDAFSEAIAQGQHGFITVASLIDTNNPGPTITNRPVSFRRFFEDGELDGVKLGMTMSEVVRQWGKPQSAYSYCYIGPRLWWGPALGEVSLSFKGDRLVLIGINGKKASNVTFDNGWTGQAGRVDCEKLLGEPTLRRPDPNVPDLVGDIAYRTNGIRMDLIFGKRQERERLSSVSIRMEKEAVKEDPRLNHQNSPPFGPGSANTWQF